MSARLISAVFPGKCPVCGTAYAKGAPIYFDKAGERGRKAWCREHGERPTWKPEPAPAPLFDDPAPVVQSSRDPLNVQREGSALIAEFGSLSDYVLATNLPAREQTNELRRRGYIEGRRVPEKVKKPYDWHGISPDEDIGEAYGAFMARLARDGWPRGLRTIEELAREIDQPAPPQSLRRRRTWGDQGDSVDMGRVWSGDLSRAWSRTARTSARAPRHFTVHINPNQPWFESAVQIMYRAAAGLVLADALTSAGYTVQIRLTSAVSKIEHSGSQVDLVHSTIVKPFGAPLDCSALSVIAHPLIVRALDFALRCRTIGARKVSGNMGFSAQPKHVAPQWFASNPGAVVGEYVSNAETARAWIAARIAELENPEQAAA